MTNETMRRPSRCAASRPAERPDNPDAIEITMKAVATGADQQVMARGLISKARMLRERIVLATA